MSFDYDLPFNVIKWLAVMCRVGAFILPMHIFVSSNVPTRFKMLLIGAISFILLPSVPQDFIAHPLMRNLNLLTLTVFMLAEVVIGLIASMVFMTAEDVFRFGGHDIDQAVGLIMAQEIDPSTNVSSSLFSTLLVQVFFVVFLIFDGHHEVIRIAAASFRTLPPGSFLINEELVNAVASLTARIFAVGMQIALPVMAVNFMLNVGMGLMVRVGEDFPVLMLSFPLRLGLGFIVLMTITPVLLMFCRQMNDLIGWWLMGIAGIH